MSDKLSEVLDALVHDRHFHHHRQFPKETCPAWPCDLVREERAKPAATAPSQSQVEAAAREIVEVIETEREPYPAWSEKARRKYQDAAVAVITKHLSAATETPNVRAAVIDECVAKVTQIQSELGGNYEGQAEGALDDVIIALQSLKEAAPVTETK